MYKHLIILSLGLTLSVSLSAQTEKELKSKISDVTVYLSGAEVHRYGNTTLNSGSSQIKLTGLSPSIDPSSIQVKGKGNFIILSVNHKLNYLNESEKPRQILALEDSMARLNTRIKMLSGMEKVYTHEESMILANKAIGNKEVGVDALDLEEVANVFRRRLMEISEKRITVQEKAIKAQAQYAKLNSQLRVLNGKRNRSTGEITIIVTSKERTPAKFDISYFINGAGWRPMYDIRAKNITSPVTLDYKAKVSQNSGVDWNNVKLTLSTLSPKRSGTQPILNPWTLQYQTAVSRLYDRSEAGLLGYFDLDTNSEAPAFAAGKYLAVKAEEQKPASKAVNYTLVAVSTLSVEFKISLPYSIPADGQHHEVHVARHELPVNFKHFSVPKLDLDAFLLAEVTGWEDYKLLSGNASIYFEGTYVGKSYINTKTTDDTLSLSFGRDQSVNIKREKLKDFTSKKFLGDNKKESFAYEITVRNTKKVPIRINLEDQVPLSSTKEIEVEVTEVSGAKYNKVSGKLAWELELQGGETKKLKLIYSIKYPKGQTIRNL
ncbi:MAG: DUF4139 domain-containing protein [Flavobacteriales bacterium]|nr:DUF4139 domain-containing protein [Flavobacteriales bacterium]